MLCKLIFINFLRSSEQLSSQIYFNTWKKREDKFWKLAELGSKPQKQGKFVYGVWMTLNIVEFADFNASKNL